MADDGGADRSLIFVGSLLRTLNPMQQIAEAANAHKHHYAQDVQQLVCTLSHLRPPRANALPAIIVRGGPRSALTSASDKF